MGDSVPVAVTQVAKHDVELLSGAQGKYDYQVKYQVCLTLFR